MSSEIRHEWYQTEQKVVVSVFIKNAQSRNCIVQIERESFSVTADDVSALEFKLAHPINEAQSTFKLLSVKLEVTLKKLSGDRWDTLEKVAERESAPAQNMQAAQSAAPSAGVAPKDHKDWDKLVKDICEKEDIEKVSASLRPCVALNNGDLPLQPENDAVNSLFQKIYSDSNPEIQRAMNKSFTESGKATNSLQTIAH